MTRIKCTLGGVNGEPAKTGDAAGNTPWTRGPIDEFFGMRVQIRPDKPLSLSAGRFGVIRSAPHYLRDDELPHYHVIEDGDTGGCFHHADDLIPIGAP